MTKFFIITDDFDQEYEVCQHESQRAIDCDGCDNKIKCDDYYSMADAGEKYCIDCSTTG